MDVDGNLLKKDGFSVRVGTTGTSDFNAITSKVYPNPTSGRVTAEIQEGSIKKVELYTIDGKNVSNTFTELNARKWQISFPEVSGQYILIIYTTQGSSKQIIEVR